MDTASTLLRPESSFQKLLSLSSAALVETAFNHSLSLSLLLKGPRGVGKFTVLNLVARNLGVHVLEVFDLSPEFMEFL